MATLSPDEIGRMVEAAYLDSLTEAERSRLYGGRDTVWYDMSPGDTLATPQGQVTFVERIAYGDDDCTGRVQWIFELGGQHYAKDGMYYSHSGTEWEYGDVNRVKKQTRTVTVTEWSTVR